MTGNSYADKGTVADYYRKSARQCGSQEGHHQVWSSIFSFLRGLVWSIWRAQTAMAPQLRSYAALLCAAHDALTLARIFPNFHATAAEEFK